MSNYIFYKGFDYFGCDIKHVENKSIEELKEICDNDDACIGFNSLGYLKYFIGTQDLFIRPSCFNTDTSGLYVKNTKKNNKKIICFYLGYASLFKELYGSELALINIAKLFNEEYYVYLVGFDESNIKHNIKYLNIKDYREFQKINKIDILIISRYINYFLECNLTASKTYIWLHDTYMLPYWNGQNIPLDGKNLITNIDNKITGYICVSQWHKDLIKTKYSLLDSKMHVISNAISNKSITLIKDVIKIKNRFIYISAPNRGLNKAVEYFNIIKQTIPDATFYIYRGVPDFNTPALQKLLEYITNTTDIYYGGSINNEQIMIELSKSDVWFYPTDFAETFCTSGLEAMACGCLCVTTDMSSPSTLISDRGLLLKSPIYSDDYKNECVNNTINILLDDDKKKEYQNKAKTWAFEQTWNSRYLEWHNLLFS